VTVTVHVENSGNGTSADAAPAMTSSDAAATRITRASLPFIVVLPGQLGEESES
jgi:hypothetical protein